MIMSRMVGCGGYLPEKIVTNNDLEKLVDTSDEWIQVRTGIKQRHIAAEGQYTSDLATQAAKKALKLAQLSPTDIDLIIVATTTPDNTFPAVAVEVQAKLGAKNAFGFDVQAVCSGFIYALSTADKFITSGQAKTALVIGAETMSRILDWEDRSTCVLFGDGAGAFVLQADNNDQQRGILSTHLHSDGCQKELLYVDGGAGQGDQKVGYLRMQGRSVFRNAVEKIGGSIIEALKYNNLTPDDIDWFVPHQANRRIIEGIANRFKLPREKVVITVDRHANTSAASVPLAMAELASEDKLKPCDIVILEALGGGLAWGSAAIRI